MILSDADEIPDSQRLNAVLACHGYLTDGKVPAGGVIDGLAPV